MNWAATRMCHGNGTLTDVLLDWLTTEGIFIFLSKNFLPFFGRSRCFWVLRKLSKQDVTLRQSHRGAIGLGNHTRGPPYCPAYNEMVNHRGAHLGAT